MNWLDSVVLWRRKGASVVRASGPIMRWPLVLSLLIMLVSTALPSHAAASNLLEGKGPVRSNGAQNVGRLTDDYQAQPGGAWDSHLTVRLPGGTEGVVYDLGKVSPIGAAYLQADNNDEYILEGSLDGRDFSPIWVAPPVSAPGLQARMTDSLRASARFVKLTARGGDGRFSLSELQLFPERPRDFPPRVRERSGLPLPELVRSKMLLAVFALLFWVFATRRGMANHWFWLMSLVPAAAAVLLYQVMSDAWPVTGRDVSLARGLAAGLAGLVLLRWIVAPKLYPAHPMASLGTLAISAAVGFMGFYNLGHPQFRDQAANEPLYVHNFDMRVYYPVAKYFPELRFNGLYQASVAAYVDDVPGVSLDSLANVELRDLTNHRMTRVSDVKDQINAIQSRFSPPRWEAFKTDMRYFRETMGVKDYLGSMVDHGGNATPVWLTVAHFIFAGTVASNATLWWAGMLDPILILLALGIIGRTFGIRTMLVSAVVFGANDFYMFGSNWGGATLRHDWMAYLAIGICSLKAKRPRVGGAFLALSALIRAFPALALASLAIPAGWSLFEHWREHRKLPSLREFLDEHKDFVQAVVGATACIVAFFLLSSMVFSFDAWPEWFAKVRLLDSTPHTNHVSLRALVAGSTHLQRVLMEERSVVFAACAALVVAMIVLLGRKKSLDQAALLGTLLIPIVFNPANYYIHFIFVLPLLARERRGDEDRPFSLLDTGVLWAILAVCVTQYWTTLVARDYDLHFQMATAVFFAGMTGLFACLLRREWLTQGFVFAAPGVISASNELAYDEDDLDSDDTSYRDDVEDGEDGEDGPDEGVLNESERLVQDAAAEHSESPKDASSQNATGKSKASRKGGSKSNEPKAPESAEQVETSTHDENDSDR